jgi:predicted PurR-regulated permease PerM
MGAAWKDAEGNSRVQAMVARLEETPVGRWLDQSNESLSLAQREKLNTAVLNAVTAIASELSEKTLSLVADVAAFLVGFAVMAIALYYFLADGERILTSLQQLSPLPNDDERELWQQFALVSRSVVMGTLVAGLSQAVLAAIGFAVVGVRGVWLLAALTWFTSLIPFVGAAAVWLVVCAGLALDERYVAALLLAVYGTVVISGADNLIRAYVVGGESRMHPLIVLVSMLGAIRFVGLWGIFVGPIIAAFFYSLMCMLQKHSLSPSVRRRRKRRKPPRPADGQSAGKRAVAGGG